MTDDERVRAELARAQDDVLHPWHADEPLPWDDPAPEPPTMPRRKFRSPAQETTLYAHSFSDRYDYVPEHSTIPFGRVDLGPVLSWVFEYGEDGKDEALIFRQKGRIVVRVGCTTLTPRAWLREGIRENTNEGCQCIACQPDADDRRLRALLGQQLAEFIREHGDAILRGEAWIGDRAPSRSRLALNIEAS